MSILDLFKKKQKEDAVKQSITTTVDVPAETVTSTVGKKEEPKKTQEELFDEWYSKLTPEMRKRVDQKMEKLKLKYGTPICCIRCKKAGSNKETGPFRKIGDGYIHQNCQVGGVRG